MDEEAVKTMYTLAQSQGYQDSQADFEQLLATDAKALGAMYRLAQDKGYTEDLESFEILMGLKKKEEPVVTESVSDAGSSEQRLASRDFEAERMSAFGAAGGGRVVDSREVPQEGYKSPAEIAKRDSATTAINTREANIAAAQLSQRQEEAQRITADLPPVAIPEGSVTDALQQLRDLYGPYGLQFSEEKVPAAMTRAGAKVVKATVPRGAGGKPVEVRLELGEDGNIKPSEATKVDALLRENARYVGETDQSFVEKALAVQNIRPVPRIDSSGVSTVKMASAEVDGKFIAYPTLFPKDPAGTTSTNADDWMELDFGIEAQNEAFKRGEVFYFDTEEEARAFGEGAWKGVVPMDLEFQKRSQELGRDYDSDMAFLDELTERRDEYKFIEDLPPPGGRYEEGLIPASYQKYFIDGNMVRDDIEAMRDEKEAELSILEAQFDEDNVLLRLKEDRDVALGKRYEQLSTEAAEINADAKLRQNQLQAESLKNFGVRLEDLAAYEPKTEEELRGMIGLYNDYNQAASQRQAAALGYERAQTYYDKQYDKGITQDYVDGWEEVSVAWDNGWKRGEAMSKLLLMQMGYYSVIGDEGAEERAMREVSEIMDSQDPRRGRLVSRANMTGTTDSYLASIASNPGMYTAAITAESLGQLVPIWAKVLPAAAVGGAAYGAVAGPGGSILGTLGAIGATALESAFMIGMPISELALEMGNATLEVGERMGYDWSDPNSALKALNDEKLWADATQRGLERGVPIASMGVLSNFFIGAAVRRSASLASTGERVLRGAGTGLIAEPATEAIGEYMAIQTTGEYTGSTANFREIMAEAIGAVGMGVSMGASFGALGYAKQTLQESNFDLAVKLMDPMSLGAENVSGQRIMNWANKMEKLGQITPEQAEYIRKNTGYRRQANELLGRDVDARPGTKAKAVGRLMQLLEAKDHLSKPGTSFAFGRKLSEINEEISYIAENQSNRSEQVDLSLIDTRTRQSQPGAYRFNGKNVSRQDFLSKLQEATPRQLRKARAYNDSQAAAELKAKRDAISKRGTEEVPVGKRTGFGTEVDEEVREATQEDLQAEEEGSLDTDRKLDILQSIAEKLNDDTELTEVEQAFFNDNEEDIKTEQERFKALDQEAAEVEVLGEPEVEGRVPLKRLKRLAANAKKAMAKNFEGANIIIHADKDSYQQAAQENGLTGERSAGFLATDNKTVHVFAPLASETTIAHETFHVVLRNSVDKAQTQELMGEFVTTLKKVIPTDSDLAAKLDRFQKRYEEGKINEEYVAEFFGELAAAYPTLDKNGKSVIARFLERMSKLLGLDLTLSPDLTKRDQQVLSLLERLAGQVSRGETITAREAGELAEMARSTSRKKTEDNLSAAEQKVDDFSDEQIQDMAEQGVAFHFSKVDITKVLPEKLKRTIYGYGFYTTSAGQSNSVFRTYGDRVTLIDTNQLNLLNGDTRITEEQAKKLRDFAKMELEELDETGELVYFPDKAIVLQSLAELKAGAAWANVLVEGSAEAVFGDVQMVPRELASRSTRPDVITYDITQQAQVAALIQEAFGFDGADFGRGVNMDDTGYGIISAIWNFPKIDRAIIEPGQEPTRAAEQRVEFADPEMEFVYQGVTKSMLDQTFSEFLKLREREGLSKNTRKAYVTMAYEVGEVALPTAMGRRMPDNLKLASKINLDGTVEPVSADTRRLLLDAENVLKSVSRIMPELKIVVHDGSYGFQAQINNRDWIGAYSNTRKTIYINAPLSFSADNEHVLYHELFHALLDKATESPEKRAFLAHEFEMTISKVLPKDSQLLKDLREHTSKYELGLIQFEEFTVEFFGKLAASYKNQPSKVKGAIKRFIERVSNLIGYPVKFNENLTGREQDTLALLDIISKAAVEGEILAPGTLEQLAGTPTEEGPFRAGTPRAAEQRVDDLETSIDKSVGFAEESTFDNKIEFKRALQERFNQLVLPELEARYGITDSSELNDSLKEYLVDAYMNETLNAIAAYPDALGWYDSRITGAMSLMSLLHPELATDPDAASAFKIGLAITSNGNKVYDNFVEANRQYKYYKENGRFDESRSIGNQVGGILSNLKFANEALGVMSMAELTQFLTTKHKVGSLSYRDSAGKKKNLISGFGVNEEVYGAAVFGPKIGNGFFMNLYGVFDQLTMDRWFMRQYGRLTGTLLDFDQKKVDTATKRLARARKALLQRNSAKVEGLIGAFENLSDAELAQKVQKASVDIKKRAVLKSSPKLDEFRKASNNLAKLLEAEVEAPTPAKRRFINEVFSELQQKLKDENGIDITIADLQAVNWYPEKALYQTFKADQTQKSAKTETSDNEQPDYESAARKLVEKQGVTKAQIDGRQIERDDTARDADQQRAAELLEDDEATSQLRDRILSIREDVTTDDLKAAEQRVDVETEGPTIVYRAGDVTDKAEPRGMMDGGRQTGHFGTGAYFFSDRKRAREYAKRTGDRDVTAVDTRDYNLAPASKELHEALRDVNSTSYREFDGPRKEDEFEMSDFIRVTRALGRYDEFFGNVQLDLAASDEVLRKQLREASAMEARQRELVREANRVYNEPGNFDSRSTVVMKTLGYEGVYATPGSNMDNSTYGTVIYDVRTEAAEQRVVDPGVVDVLERYEFKPNKSLKNAELAPELNRNLQRFGYGVKQYGTRMNDFRVISLDTGRAVDPNDIIAAGVEERAARLEEERRMVEMERQLELKQRIIEIYNADERPFTGKDFETRGVEQKVAAKAMAEPGTIADLVARGRELGLRDAAIRSVLLKRFGKDNADAIDTALTEYFDMFRAIPEAFGNVEGGIEVGRQIYDDVRRQLDEFARPKKPERMTKRERTDRIEELRAKFPEQKNLSDTELLRKHPRQAVAPSIAEVRAEALNMLRNNSSFNEQTTEVQEQLLVAFDKTLQTSANKRVNTLMAQIRNNIRQRRKGESSAKAVRNELRKVINELLPAGKYTKAEAKALARLVSNVTEKNMLVQIQKVTDLLEKKAKADIKAELRDIKKLDSRIRSERKYAEREARKVQNNLRKLINEVIPRADYGKTDIAKLTRLVASVNEINYEEKAEQVLELVEKKRGQIRDSLVRDIAKFVANAAKTKRTPSGKVRPRSLDAPGQAYFREANRILRAILNKDQSLIMDIAANLANNPLVDVATQKMLNGEKLTMREQQLVDQKYALDMFAGIQDKSLEEVESILEDLKVDVGFSRANLKATRAARAARMAELREGAKAEVQDNWAGFATNEDGSAKTRNQLEADKTQKKTIGDALRENGLRAKYDALVEWAKEGKRLTPAGIARNAANITHVGALTGIMGEYFRENLYKRLGKMEERHLKGVFETKDKLDEMASTIEGIENYKDITDLIFTSNPDGLMVNTKATGRRKLSTDEMMRIYALSRNPVQQAKLEAMGFTDEVMNEIVDAVDNRLLEFVDKTVDYLANDYYEGINDVYSKVNDINLGYIENYFPTRTQVKGDLSVKSKEETLSSTFFGPNAQVATALKERTDQKGEILMSQDLGFHGELGNHFNTMERFKAYAEGVQEMNAVLSSDYTVALSGRLRADAMLNVLIAHGVTPDMFMSDMSFKSVDALISNYTGASLAFKLMQIPKQATSFIGGFQQYRFGDKPNPVKDLIMFAFDYAVLVPQMMLEGVTLGKYKGPIASIAKDSATFRARLESNFSGDVYGLTAGVSGRPRKVSAKDYKLARKAAATLRKGSGTATAFGDIMGVLGYLPAYNRNRMRGMSQEEAVDLLNEYNETQQSRRPGERTPLQIRQNGLTRAFMAFTSSQILYLNNTLRHANNINKAIRKGEKVKAVDSRGLIFNAVMSSVLFTLASNIFVLLFGNDEEKERAYLDTLFSPAKNLLILPIWGAALEEFYNLYVGNEYPTDVAIDPLGKVVRDMKKVATKGEVVPAVKSVGELALGTNFDPGLSLINIATGEPIEPELYNLIGVPKSQRPED